MTSNASAQEVSHLERPFRCLECHHAFRRVEHLTRHARSHKSERNLECSYCHKSFYRLDALKRHEKVHAEPKRSLLGKGGRACLACAASRRKCSGDSPCSACERRSIECGFPAAGKRRRGPLGTALELASNSSAVEDVITSPRESIMSWSNASQSPFAAGNLTYQPEFSDQASEKRPSCSRCKSRRVRCEHGTAQPRKSRSQTPASIQYDGYEEYPNDDWTTPD
ncbi:hypothetical protein V498_04140, partial [Pseudogymnoascus sp. VKM F-4517 (FW-2822)]